MKPNNRKIIIIIYDLMENYYNIFASAILNDLSIELSKNGIVYYTHVGINNLERGLNENFDLSY